MTQYAIVFYDRFVPDFTLDQLREISKSTRPLMQEMSDAGVLVFTGGLDAEAPVFSVDPDGTFTDGPMVETKEYLGGLCVVDVPDEDAARMWAARVAAACTWPQQVHPFLDPGHLDVEREVAR